MAFTFYDSSITDIMHERTMPRGDNERQPLLQNARRDSDQNDNDSKQKVDFDEGDPENPQNWPLWRKHLNFALANFYAVMVFVNIDATTPTWGPMGTELHFSDATLNDTCKLMSIVHSYALPDT